MLALAGEIADGVILNWCTPERVAQARAAISRREGFTISVYVRACLSHVDEHALEALKNTAARYVSLPPYARQFEAMGLGKEAAAASEGLERDGYPVDVVPDRLVERTCVWGAREKALSRLQEYRDAGADLVVLYPVPAGEAVSSLTGTLMAAAPEQAL
jgi:alkanesulfonate monooxygenase SsuD/methylene tetrahydromethanopterin reductase-like flavin-dependent oxidoreductase (luciferase family)